MIPATDLRLTCDALRPISDRPTTWARLHWITCVTQQKFAWDKIFKSDLRPNYDRVEWHTHRVNYDQPAKTCDQRGIQLRVGSLASEINKFHDRFLTVKSGCGACRFQWRVGPSYCEYSWVTYDLLVSHIGGPYDLADQLPSNREFGHFFGRKSVPSPSGVRCKPGISSIEKWTELHRRFCLNELYVYYTDYVLCSHFLF